MTTPYRYAIFPEIFRLFPGYVRGVVVATGVTNRPSPEELVRQMRQAEADLRTEMSLEGIAEHPRIKSWREAYRSFGAKPSEFRSSIEALSRRVLHGDELPSINTLVDIGNIVSLHHLTPAGGHAIDLLAGDIALRRAAGSESFTAFGSDVLEHPLPGEVIFAEGETVLTRRWTWRQATHTLTELTTTAIEFNVDGLLPVLPEEVGAACLEIMELVGEYCGGALRYELLTEQNPAMDLAV